MEFAADVLLSDIGMPGEDGYGLIHRVRGLDSDKARIPAIALTAYTRGLDIEAALRAGFHKHLAKPVDPRELVRTVVALARK
jgi:CheY-like chemotaxis protein